MAKIGAASKKIIFVASAFHIKRAEALSNQNGFILIAYPVDFKADITDLTPISFIPSTYALKDAEFAPSEVSSLLFNPSPSSVAAAIPKLWLI